MIRMRWNWWLGLVMVVLFAAAVATATGGTYSPASDRAELQSVLAKLPRQTVTATETVEIAPALAALGALLLLGAVAIAIRQRRFP